MDGTCEDLERIALESARLAVILRRLRAPEPVLPSDAHEPPLGADLPPGAQNALARAVAALETAVRSLRETVTLATPPHDDHAYQRSVRRAHLADVGTCTIDLSLRADGSTVFEGEDSGPAAGGGTYEYFVVVGAAYAPVLRVELGEDAGTDVFDLVLAHGARIATAGELSWLRSIGIEPGFGSWRGSD